LLLRTWKEERKALTEGEVRSRIRAWNGGEERHRKENMPLSALIEHSISILFGKSERILRLLQQTSMIWKPGKVQDWGRGSDDQPGGLRAKVSNVGNTARFGMFAQTG